jgi:hypothetical protein
MKRTALNPGTKRLASTTPLARATGIKPGKPLQPGTSQMKRTQMRPSQPAPGAAQNAPRRTTLKSRGPRMTPIRRSARNQECTLCFPVCNHDKDTTVWCHGNRSEHGKGMGLKAEDRHGCYGCSACHAFYDGGYANVPGWTRAMVEAAFDMAEAISRVILVQRGLLPPDAPTTAYKVTA